MRETTAKCICGGRGSPHFLQLPAQGLPGPAAPWKLSKEPMNPRKKGRKLLTDFMTLAGLGTRNRVVFPPQSRAGGQSLHCASSVLAPTGASQTPPPARPPPKHGQLKHLSGRNTWKCLSYHHMETSRKKIFVCSLWSQCKFPLPLAHWTLESGSCIHIGSDRCSLRKGTRELSCASLPPSPQVTLWAPLAVPTPGASLDPCHLT